MCKSNALAVGFKPKHTVRTAMIRANVLFIDRCLQFGWNARSGWTGGGDEPKMRRRLTFPVCLSDYARGAATASGTGFRVTLIGNVAASRPNCDKARRLLATRRV